MNALQSLIKSIRVDTAYGPPVVIDDPFAPGDNAAMELLKPRITIGLSTGGDPIVLTPYGDPGVSMWPLFKLVLLASTAFAGYKIFKRLTR